MLERLARDVVSNWETRDLANAVRALDEHLQRLDADRVIAVDQIAQAREMANDDLEIDDNPRVSVAEAGVWVEAWIWIEVPGAGE